MSEQVLQQVRADFADRLQARFCLDRPLVLGGRGSRMSMAQLRQVADDLGRFFPHVPTRIEAIKVAADLAEVRPMVEGKDVYTGAIDAALAAGRIDAAVHCEKDLDGETGPGSVFVNSARLARGSVLDALISPERLLLAELPTDSRIGTCAPRRIAQLRRLRPDLLVVPVKGNVDSRIARLHDGSAGVDALVVSYEGLLRLGMPTVHTQTFSLEQVAPAVGSAVVTVQTRRDDLLVTGMLATLGHFETEAAARAERAMLADLGGNCSSAVSGHATVDHASGRLTLTGKVFSPDGTETVEYAAFGPDPWELGRRVAQVLTARGAHRLLAAAELEGPK